MAAQARIAPDMHTGRFPNLFTKPPTTEPESMYIPARRLPTQDTVALSDSKSLTRGVRRTPKVYAIPSSTRLHTNEARQTTQPQPPSGGSGTPPSCCSSGSASSSVSEKIFFMTRGSSQISGSSSAMETVRTFLVAPISPLRLL